MRTCRSAFHLSCACVLEEQATSLYPPTNYHPNDASTPSLRDVLSDLQTSTLENPPWVNIPALPLSTYDSFVFSRFDRPLLLLLNRSYCKYKRFLNVAGAFRILLSLEFFGFLGVVVPEVTSRDPYLLTVTGDRRRLAAVRSILVAVID